MEKNCNLGIYIMYSKSFFFSFFLAFFGQSPRLLADLLLARGFGAKWVGWTCDILHFSSTTVLLNGIPGEFFPCKTGLRQGDPLSPLLFLLCIDVLFRMLQGAFENQVLPSVGIENVHIHTL